MESEESEDHKSNSEIGTDEEDGEEGDWDYEDEEDFPLL